MHAASGWSERFSFGLSCRRRARVSDVFSTVNIKYIPPRSLNSIPSPY